MPHDIQQNYIGIKPCSNDRNQYKGSMQHIVSMSESFCDKILHNKNMTMQYTEKCSKWYSESFL